jgi:2-polyprenyl-3-methyl-5-hydroxy-6-metoxy-1,4-benzoquinol methylase
MEMSSSACPVCGYHQFKMAFTATDYFVTKEEFAVKACIKCGMLMTAGLPKEEDIPDYYKSEDYISHSDTRKGLVNRAYHLVRDIMLSQKLRIIHKTSGKSKGSVLDIGTGTGYFLEFMQQKGWEVYGVEKSPDARDFAEKHWNLKIKSDEELFTLPPARLDVITLWHVMEHLPNLQQHWQAISKLLKPDGVLVIALPNAGSWDAKLYGSYWAAWDVPRHLWHFTPKHIEEMGKAEGFKLTKTYRMPFDGFYISIISEKYKNASFPFIKGIFYGKISWFVSLFNKKKSSSLIYVFRKTN